MRVLGKGHSQYPVHWDLHFTTGSALLRAEHVV
jgi:hypothetical protein